jgi:Flp pilus assembly pilin Flp
MRQGIGQFCHDQEGAATVEYALLLTLIVLAGLAAWENLGSVIGNMVQESADQIANGGN